MPITPPSLPTISLRESTFADDSSLALQAIAAEQSIAGLQKLGSSSEQLQASLARQQAASRTIGELQESRSRLQQSELNASQNTLATISGIGTEPPANLAELQEFLAARGLVSDLTTQEGRDQAIAALTGYVGDLQQQPDAVDNQAIRQNILQDSALQRTLRDANSLLGSSDTYARPADLASLQTSLVSEAVRLTQTVRDQVSQLVQGAQQVVVLTTDNATLGSQLVAATARGQQVAVARLEAAQSELQTQTVQLNESVRELDSLNQTVNDVEIASRLAPLVDQVKGSIQRLQAVVAILQPDAAIAAARSVNAIEQRSEPASTLASSAADKGPQSDYTRTPRMIDPSRLV